MSSSVVISNMAISHLGSGKTIVSLDESSEEARACNLFYVTARQEAFRDMKPDFATRKHVALSQIGTDPNDAWGYYYTYPSDCLRIIKIFSGIRKDNLDSRIKFELGDTADYGTVIYTEIDDALANYVIDVTAVERYPADFMLAFSYRLAWYIAPRVDRGKNKQTVLNLYTAMVDKSVANSENENVRDVEPDSELILARL